MGWRDLKLEGTIPNCCRGPLRIGGRVPAPPLTRELAAPTRFGPVPRTEALAVMIDTFRPLRLGLAAGAIEDERYPWSRAG